MTFDWFTFSATILNFLVLLYLLKRFLYRPILTAMDDRRRRIAARLEEAEKQRSLAETEARAYQVKHEEIEANRRQLLARANEEAAQLRRDLGDQARREADEQRQQWLRILDQEKDAFLRDLKSRASRQIFEAVDRALRELADEDLERRIVDVFIGKLQKLTAEERQEILTALRRTRRKLMVLTSFPIKDDQRRHIEALVTELFAEDIDLNCFTDPAMSCGIEIRGGGWKITWRLSHFIDQLGENLFQENSPATGTDGKKA